MMEILPTFDEGPWVVASNLFWFIAGFLSCYALVHFGLLGINFIHPKKGELPVTQTETERQNRVRNSRIARALVFITCGVLVFGIGIRVGYELLADKVNCFDDYANAAADSQKKRSTLAERDTVNQNTLLAAIAEINTQSEEATAELVKAIRQADSVKDLQDILIIAGTSEAGDLTQVFEDFNEERLAIEKEREENPVPDPPREVC